MKKVHFSDVFHFQKKSKVKAGEGVENGKYPFFTSSNIQDKYIDKYGYNEPSLIFGTGGQASIHYCEIQFGTSTDCLVAYSKDLKRCLPKFIYHFLKGNIYLLEREFKGAGLKHISKAAIENLQIPLPPLPEQKRIADMLDKADALRKKNKELLDAYNELLKATFLDMFGDPVTNPKGWEKKKISLLGKVITGNTPPRANLKNYGNFIEWIKTDNISPDLLYPTIARENLSEQGASKGRVVPKGSILVTCIAGSISSIGNCVVTDRDVAFNQQINAIVPKGNSFFFYSLMQYSKKLTQDGATNGMKKIITKSNFGKLSLINPPEKLQVKFGRIVENIEAQKNLVKQSLQESEDLFNGLVQKAFKGY